MTDSDWWWYVCPWLSIPDTEIDKEDVKGMQDASLILTVNPLADKWLKGYNVNAALDFLIPRIPSVVPEPKSYAERTKGKKAAIIYHSMPPYRVKTNLEAVKRVGLKPVLIGTFQNKDILMNAINEVGFEDYEIHTSFQNDSKAYMEKLNECLIAFEDWYTGGSRFSIECAVLGIPIVGSENVLSLKIISPENTCPNGDIECLAEKALPLINNECLYTELSKKIREKALSYFSCIETRDRLVAVLRNL
jgi:hypothetical protein